MLDHDFRREHFIINPEKEGKLEDQRKDGQTSFKTRTGPSGLIFGKVEGRGRIFCLPVYHLKT
jgi:hypothetical protein